MNIFYVCIDPPRGSATYQELKTHYNKVGVKAGDISWYVRERDLRKRLLKTLGDRAVSTVLPNVTLKEIREARKRCCDGAHE